MTVGLTVCDDLAADAVRSFWARWARGGVLGGANMDGFAKLIEHVVRASGLNQAKVHRQRGVLTLPGYFRPTKLWDLLVTCQGQLIAAIEFKSQVGPSFGNNFNNRAEEAIGTGQDLRVAFREGAFGEQPLPFVGWLMLVEDAAGSRSPVNDRAPHFQVSPEFQGASYLGRYEVLCRRLMREQLYSRAAVLTTVRDAAATGQFGQMSDLTNLRTFVSGLAGHCAAEAARLG